jgi:hypothetical protein
VISQSAAAFKFYKQRDTARRWAKSCPWFETRSEAKDRAVRLRKSRAVAMVGGVAGKGTLR